MINRTTYGINVSKIVQRNKNIVMYIVQSDTQNLRSLAANLMARTWNSSSELQAMTTIIGAAR